MAMKKGNRGMRQLLAILTAETECDAGIEVGVAKGGI
jgi:hypothetical protein